MVKALLGARDDMLTIRCNMRKMGEAAGIPVGCSTLSWSVFFVQFLNQSLVA